MSIKYVCWLCIEMFDCVFWESHEQIEGEGIIVDLSSSKIREKPTKPIKHTWHYTCTPCLCP